MTGLRRIKPLPLPASDLKPIAGAKPELIWSAPTALLVDSTYQRDLSDRSLRLIKKMVDEFAWNRMKPPIVVRVSGGLHVVDGQHTAIATATLGIPEIPVFVVEATTTDERARAFVGHNTDRVIVSQFDIHRALVASGDPEACKIEAVCKAARVRIRQMSPGCQIDVGDTASIGSIRKIVKRRGEKGAKDILDVLVMAKRGPILQAEILAAEEILFSAGPLKVDSVNLARVIRIDGDAGLIAAQAKSKTDRAPFWQTLRTRWLNLYRKAASS